MRIPKEFHEPQKARLKGREAGKALAVILLGLLLWSISSCTIQKHNHITIYIMAKKKPQTQQFNFLNKYQAYARTTLGETNTEPSQTSQGEAISMAEMIRRYTRGEIPPLAEAAFHGKDIDMDKYDGSRHPGDLSEVSTLAQQEKDRQQEVKALEGLKTSEAKAREKERAERGDESEATNSEATNEAEA